MKTFYHGTSDAMPICKVILPPVQTSYKREDWRQKFTDKVFFTDSVKSASMYAKKACQKYGGNPIVYVVRPVGEIFHINKAEYIADKAIVCSAI